MASQLVSVVIPTYYRNGALGETIASALGQTHEPVEVVVVDDSGERHAAPVVERFDDVRYVAFPENRGVNAARQAGAERANGEYVQFLDDDDRVEASKFRRQLAAFDGASADVGVVYCGVETSRGVTYTPDPGARGDVLEQALAFELWPCMTSTMLIERDALDTILPLADREAGTDLEQMIQLARRHEFEFVDEPLVCKQVDDSSKGHSTAAAEARFDIVEEYGDLYDAHPDEVRRRALANAHRTRGEILLCHHAWSWQAIASFAASARYLPDPGPKALAQPVAALFGSPGWTVARLFGRHL